MSCIFRHWIGIAEGRRSHGEKAEADAQQTKLIAEAIANNGQPAVDFEILKRQVDAIALMASSENTKTIVLPSDVTKTLGGLAGLQDVLRRPDGA